MQTIEKINGIFKSFRNGISKIFDFIIKIKDILWFAIIVIVSFFLISKCNSNDKLEREIDILNNNTYALTDSLRHYRDEFGNAVAEKHALQLSQEQMEKIIGELKEKNTEYISYINTNLNLKDTIYVEKIVFKDVNIDTITNIEKGIITLEKNDTFDKSKRYISAIIPYTLSYPSKLNINDVSFTLEQNIFVEGVITRNNKTDETMFYLKSDYPGVTFNSGNAIVATNSKQYDREMRKKNGIGLAIGPSLGIYSDGISRSYKPAFGFSLTVGYTLTPKIFQW